MEIEARRRLVPKVVQRLMTLRQACLYLGMSPDKIRFMTDTGELPALRVGDRRMFELPELERWIAQQARWNGK